MDIESRILDVLAKNDDPCTYGFISLSLTGFSFQEICTAIDSLSKRGIVVSDYMGVRLAKPTAGIPETPEMLTTFGFSEKKSYSRSQEEQPAETLNDNEKERETPADAPSEEESSFIDIFADDFMIGTSFEKPRDDETMMSDDEFDALLSSLGYKTPASADAYDDLLEYSNEPIIGAAHDEHGATDEKAAAEYDTASPQTNSCSEEILKEFKYSSRLHATDPVGLLDLPTRARNVLKRIGVSTIEELVSELNQFPNRKNIGLSTYETVLSMLFSGSRPLGNNMSSEQVAALQEASGSSYFCFDLFGFLCRIDYSNYTPARNEMPSPVGHGNSDESQVKLEPDEYDGIPIEKLGLSASTCNLLKRNRIRTVGALRHMTEKDLLAVRSLGLAKAEEIKNALEGFFNKVVQGSEEPVGEKGETIIETRHAMLADSKDHPISVLGLSSPTERRLRQNHIDTVERLLQMSEDDLLRLPQVGLAKVEEIKTSLEAFCDGINVHNVSRHTSLSDAPFDRHIEADRYDHVPIETLKLADPIKEKLASVGYGTVGAILRMTADDLRRIPYLGTGKIEAIGKALDIFLSYEGDLPTNASNSTASQPPLDYNDTFTPEERDAAESAYLLLLEDYLPVYEKTFNTFALPLARALSTERDLSANECARAIVETLGEAGTIIEACKQVITEKLLKAIETEGKRIFAEAIPIPHREFWGKAARIVASEHKRCVFNEADSCIRLSHPSISEWIETLNERTASLLRMRINGASLKDCGEQVGLTRERVRQICVKALANRPLLEEDRYADFFLKYSMDVNTFVEVFDVDPFVYHYLKLTVEDRGRSKKPLQEALDDDAVPAYVKKAIRKRIDAGFVFEDDERIKIDRKTITEYLIKRYASDKYITVEELIGYYKAFLAKHNVPVNKNLSIKNTRAFEAFIDRLDTVLCIPHNTIKDYGGNIRYYDSTSYDFSLLTQAVMSGTYSDIECTSMLLLRNPMIREVAELYDIQNGYELHYILKRFCGRIRGLTFGSTPTLVFGSGNRNAQILDLIEEIGPVSAAELAAEYELHYGVDQLTFKGTYLKGFEFYKRNGKYSISRDSLSTDQTVFLQGLLIDDYVPLPLIKLRFEDKFPDAPAGAINEKNLAKLGYMPSGELLIRSDLNPRELFASLLDAARVFSRDTPGFPAEMFRNGNFLAELRMRMNSLDIIEYQKNAFINTAELRKLEEPITKEAISDFIEHALEFMKPNRPYTIKSLKNEGFSHSLISLFENAGFDDYALSSVLGTAYVGGRLKRTSISDVAVFSKTRYSLSSVDVFDSILEEKKYMEIDDLCDYAFDHFGIEMNEAFIRITVKRAGLYYSEPLDMVFIDEETYREKVSEWIY